MIVEGIVTTLNDDGSVNIAPMGPIVDEKLESFVFRPFQTSATYRNLKSRQSGVFHITDDVALVAATALNQLDSVPTTIAATRIDGRVLMDCCRWYEFEIIGFDDSNERTSFDARVVHVGRVRDMWGFNRAKHAVLEATILATRLHLLPEAEVRNQLKALEGPIQKTAGPRELAAYEIVTRYVAQWYRRQPHGD